MPVGRESLLSYARTGVKKEASGLAGPLIAPGHPEMWPPQADKSRPQINYFRVFTKRRRVFEYMSLAAYEAPMVWVTFLYVLTLTFFTPAPVRAS